MQWFILLHLFLPLLLLHVTCKTTIGFTHLPPHFKSNFANAILQKQRQKNHVTPFILYATSHNSFQQEKKSKRTVPKKSRNSQSQSSSHPKERTVVLLYHKPSNIITSHANTDAISIQRSSQSNNNSNTVRTTVYDDITTMKGYVGKTKGTFEQATHIKSKLHAIGRLDADTTGLLLFTNDGGLVHHVTNPTSSTHSSSSSIKKTYQATIMGHYNATSPQIQTLLQQGVDIGSKYGGMTKPANNLLILSHPTAKSTCVEITISEGKNRQIRRMFHAIGSGVLKLHRCCVGNLNLGNLKEGEWRVLHKREVEDGLGWTVRTLDGNGGDKKRRGSGKENVSRRKKQRRRR